MARANTQWLRDAGWGVMCHYLAGLPGGGEDAYADTADEWNAQVDAFRLGEFADQIASTGAGYLLFTVGQNSGHYCAPNPVYDELTGLRGQSSQVALDDRRARGQRALGRERQEVGLAHDLIDDRSFC